MSWKDFFYFSKGERRALILLIVIISITLLLLIVKDYYLPGNTASVMSDSIIVVQDTTSILETDNPDQIKPKRLVHKPVSGNNQKYSSKPKFKKSAPTYSQKYPKGTRVDLNSADTTVLKKVPGIGSAFAKRIVKYRELLGGYYSVEQLREVYGIDEEKYQALFPWFCVDTTQLQKRPINLLPFKELIRHPYLNKPQTNTILDLRERKGPLTGWDNLFLLDEFSVTDISRLKPYFSFE